MLRYSKQTEGIQDAREFHEFFKKICDRHDPSAYNRFKKWLSSICIGRNPVIAAFHFFASPYTAARQVR